MQCVEWNHGTPSQQGAHGAVTSQPQARALRAEATQLHISTTVALPFQ